MAENDNQITHYEIWKRFDEMCEHMTDKEKRLCSYHKYYDAYIKAKYSED